MENQPKFSTSKDIIAYLAAQFPQCFSVEGEAKPLKIGIFQDLVASIDSSENISKVKLRAALRTYTLSWRYLHSIKEGADRVDLNGMPCEKLTAEHVEHAKQQLDEAKAKVKAKRLQQKETKTVNNKEVRVPNGAKTFVNKKPVDGARKNIKNNQIAQTTKSVNADRKPVDLSTLKAGDQVRITLSSKPVEAVLIAIEKENVRVKIPSGMELTVRSEYLIE
ncbi:RNA chaperone ProQ [Utexia brackfieldae]|uniref:RNA chaperone ProQ n=1 Tax=Utexia brackfieldae TaxID=3074108 RepID=UPI00370D58A8